MGAARRRQDDPRISIGSGTKLAMEDAIALADAMALGANRRGGLQLYETGGARSRESPARRRRCRWSGSSMSTVLEFDPYSSHSAS